MSDELEIAGRVALESNCVRRQVGAILKNKDGKIVAFGFNEVAGVSTCANVCPRAKRSYKEVPAFSDYSKGAGACYSEHAEIAALRMAGKSGIEVAGMTMFVTCQPCPDCQAMLTHNEVKVVYKEG